MLFVHGEEWMGQLEQSFCIVAICLHSPNITGLCTRFQSGLFRFSSEACSLHFIHFWETPLGVCKLRFQVELKRNISVTSGAVVCQPGARSLFTITTAVFIVRRREREEMENFLSPSPARMILYFYWTSEMVRVWSYDPVGQWNLLLRKLCGEEKRTLKWWIHWIISTSNPKNILLNPTLPPHRSNPNYKYIVLV